MKERGVAVIFLLLVIIVVSILTGAGYYFFIYQKGDTGLTKVTSLLSPSPVITEKPVSTPTVAVTATPTLPTPVVVFEAAGSFTQSEKDLITQKVIKPFIDYNQDLEDQADLVSITINHSDTPGFPYSVNAIFANGGTSGFLVSGSGGDIDWWLPDCMGECPFTPEFKAKYPELVSQF